MHPRYPSRILPATSKTNHRGPPQIYLQDTRFPSPPFEAYHESSYCRPDTVKGRTSRRQLNIGPIEINGLGGLHYPDSATFFNKVSVVYIGLVGQGSIF